MTKTATLLDWETAPNNVIKAFTAIAVGNRTKSSIAQLHGVSPSTITRWQEKYDYRGYASYYMDNLTLKELAQIYYVRWKDGVTSFGPLLTFQKTRKKGWAALGFTKVQINSIEKALAS